MESTWRWTQTGMEEAQVYGQEKQQAWWTQTGMEALVYGQEKQQAGWPVAGAC